MVETKLNVPKRIKIAQPKTNFRKTLAQNSAKADEKNLHSNWRFKLEDVVPFDPLLGILLVLAKMNNISTSPQALTSGLPLVEHKLTPETFKRAASRIGLSAKIVRSNLHNVKNQQLPIILLLKNAQACLVTNVNLQNATATTVQPETGTGYSEIPLRDLAKNYIGFAIFVKPTYHFDNEVSKVTGKPIAKHWFWSVMGKTIPFYGNVLIASLLINVFALASPLFIMNVYDRVVPNAAMPTLWVLAIGVTIVFVFDFVLRNLRAFFIDSVGRGVDNEISSSTFQHLLGLQMSSLPSSAGSLANSVHNFGFFRDFITSASISLLVDIPFAILFIIVMGFLAGNMALVPLILIPVILLLSFVAQKSIRNLVDRANQFSAEKQKVLLESLTGVETIKCMRAEGLMQRKWEVITKNLAKLNAKIRMLANIGVNSSAYLNQMAMVIVVIVGTYKIAHGDITMGAIIACVILVSRALAPVSQAAILLTRYRQSKNALDSLDRIMHLPGERESEQQFLHRPTLHGNIAFKDVMFSYPDQTVKTLDAMSFNIKPGEKIGVIGPTGSGKSTLEKLILKLYQVDSGNILIDGVEIQQIDPAELRQHIGYVPQDVVLFNGTIRDNVAITAPYVDDTIILRAIQLSGLGDFVIKHPQGLDRLVADRGKNLSGGQKQAIAIARALLLNPEIVLLDEPCNSMDDKSVAAFIHNAQIVFKNKTLILTTHQYSLLQLVDRVLVVSGGKVVLDGPKEKVLAKLRNAKQEVTKQKQKTVKKEVAKQEINHHELKKVTKPVIVGTFKRRAKKKASA